MTTAAPFLYRARTFIRFSKKGFHLDQPWERWATADSNDFTSEDFEEIKRLTGKGQLNAKELMALMRMLAAKELPMI